MSAYNSDLVDHQIALYHEAMARLQKGVRPSEEGEGRFYCVECQRWKTEPTKVIANAQLCSCGTEFLEITPFYFKEKKREQ